MEQIKIGDTTYRLGKTVGELGRDKVYEGMTLVRDEFYFRIISLVSLDYPHEAPNEKAISVARLSNSGRVNHINAHRLSILDPNLRHAIGEHEKL